MHTIWSYIFYVKRSDAQTGNVQEKKQLYFSGKKPQWQKKYNPSMQLFEHFFFDLSFGFMENLLYGSLLLLWFSKCQKGLEERAAIGNIL